MHESGDPHALKGSFHASGFHRKSFHEVLNGLSVPLLDIVISTGSLTYFFCCMEYAKKAALRFLYPSMLSGGSSSNHTLAAPIRVVPFCLWTLRCPSLAGCRSPIRGITKFSFPISFTTGAVSVTMSVFPYLVLIPVGGAGIYHMILSIVARERSLLARTISVRRVPPVRAAFTVRTIHEFTTPVRAFAISPLELRESIRE
ncbi:hypothetical protein Tco_1040809 [Tanacetum coccineum]|uniref:Uncharacterized protein n=1 Tax=Tanacetum coccineum TaxID=301880 RepID=A0ABQ5GF86_9ASTR